MDNIQLKALYTEFFEEIAFDSEIAGKCSLPLLLHVGPTWKESKHRLLIVGQETRGWDFHQGDYYDWPYPPIKHLSEFVNLANRIGVLMKGYRDFEFAKHQVPEHRSPFWRAFRHLGASPDVSVLWTNLFRVSFKGGSVIQNTSPGELNHILSTQKGLLEKEVRLLQPTAVVFFTGPYYDCALRNEFADVSFHPVQGHEERQFAQLRANSLPTQSYRTYHPNYLARSRERWTWLNQFAQLIIPS
ncbi:MAG: hypothetical protein NT179_08475 [Nitrospirae bacterium]|nr:hypothetical protein [Nitrospirota bacterium]